MIVFKKALNVVYCSPSLIVVNVVNTVQAPKYPKLRYLGKIFDRAANGGA